jgi:hypothetical protein
MCKNDLRIHWEGAALVVTINKLKVSSFEKLGATDDKVKIPISNSYLKGSLFSSRILYF